MTNTSLMVTAAPAVTSPMLELLANAHAFLPDANNNNHNHNIINHSSMAFNSSSTPRAYRTATTIMREGGGELDPGGEAGDAGSCLDWQDAQHILFQLANLCMAVSFLTPVSFRFHLLFLRCLLLLAFLLFLLWAGLFICMPDVLGWNLVFFLLNGAHIGWLLYRHLPSRLPASHVALYTKVFKPVRVTQEEFLDLCQLGSLQEISKGGLYAVESLTRCGRRVSVLVKGRLKVTYQRLFLHHIEVNQFVDAEEFDACTSHQPPCDKYQVTIAATTQSVLLTWDYQTLNNYLSSQPFMKTLFYYLIGKDVCSHLYAVQEQLMQAPEYMTTLTSRQSSMVNVRSCLAAHDSSASLARMADFTGYKQLSEFESSSVATQRTSQNTVETCV